MASSSATSAASSAKGESHRIYWQQSLSSTVNGTERSSRRELITSSAAVRIAHSGARAVDVTQLLRKTLHLESDQSTEVPCDQVDALVLVGTLYSLPRNYVQFEHELQQQQIVSADSSASIIATSTPTITRSDPFHIIRTLQPYEDPLKVRDIMEAHLKQKLEQQASSLVATPLRTIISPKLQWYYVPAASETTIPNCIELDGYCTSLEEEEEEDDESENDEEIYASSIVAGDESELCTEVEAQLRHRFPWLQAAHEDHDRTPQLPADTDQHNIIRKKLEKRTRREERRYQILLEDTESMLSFQLVSGFLLKRSNKDPHVWRRVHCVLTNDYLWYVSRIYQHDEYQYAKHGRIRLTRSLLLEPTSDYAPLFRTPYSFELVSTKGTSHIFRAPSKSLQNRWVQAISNRIVQSYENSLIEQPELIVADECLARNRRLSLFAVEPLANVQTSNEHEKWQPPTNSCSKVTSATGLLLRWCLQVQEYREYCRYIQASLPAKKPVVVSSPHRRSSPSFGISSSNGAFALPPQEESQSSFQLASPEPIDPMTLALIQASWDKAFKLHAQAVELSHLLFQKPSRSIETICRHVDYVLTGRHSSGQAMTLQSSSTPTAALVSITQRSDPPPIDLLDALVTEMVSHSAMTVDNKKLEAEDISRNGTGRGS